MIQVSDSQFSVLKRVLLIVFISLVSLVGIGAIVSAAQGVREAQANVSGPNAEFGLEGETAGSLSAGGGITLALDATFGGDGIVTTSVDIYRDVANDIIYIESENRYLAVGSSFNNADPFWNRAALVKYDVNGNLDPSWGTGGIVLEPELTTFDELYAVAMQGSKPLAAGRFIVSPSNGKAFVARYLSDGSLDMSFGLGGFITNSMGTHFSNRGSAFDLAVQDDGKFVVVGSTAVRPSGLDYISAVRFEADGALDTTFGTGGVVTVPIGSWAGSSAASVAIQEDGKIVMVGSSADIRTSIAVVRMDTNGVLDTSFGMTGIVTTLVALGSDGWDVAIQEDGKILVSGSSSLTPPLDYHMIAVRYNMSGTLDVSFGMGGVVTVPVGSEGGLGREVELLPDGYIALAGPALYEDNKSAFSAVVLDSSGNFTYTSIITTHLGNMRTEVYGLVIDDDGNFVLAGEVFEDLQSDTDTAFALVRYTAGIMPPEPKPTVYLPVMLKK